jgi:hypothetical protein
MVQTNALAVVVNTGLMVKARRRMNGQRGRRQRPIQSAVIGWQFYSVNS